MSKTIMIASGKGGTGKSMFAANLGTTLAYHGHRTILIDLDIGLRTQDLYLGVQDEAIFDICDVINDTCSITKALIKPFPMYDMFLLAGCQSRDNSVITSESLQTIISVLKYEFEYIIIDCPPGVGGLIDIAALCADFAVMVLTPDFSAVRDADALEDRLIRLGVYDRRYVLNRVSPFLVESGAELSPEAIDSRLKCGILGIISDDDSIRASTNQGLPIAIKRDTFIAENFNRMASRLMRALPVD